MSDMQKKEETKPVSGKVIRRKKRKSSGMADSFDTAWQYALENVIIPATKDLVSATISNVTDTILYGRDGVRPARSSRGVGVSRSNTRTNYQHVSSRVNTPKPTREVRATNSIDDIFFETRQDADEVLNHLFHQIDTYDVATVSDLYSKVGITPKFTDEKWGWVDLRGSTVSRTRNGFRIELPDPEYVG